jgi:hypothetical protein
VAASQPPAAAKVSDAIQMADFMISSTRFL